MVVLGARKENDKKIMRRRSGIQTVGEHMEVGKREG